MKIKQVELDPGNSPSSLWDFAERLPKKLYAIGNPESFKLLERLPQNGLAIVGTRTPTTRSVQFVSDSVEKLRNSDLIIVSGFARGIDGAAHRAALENGLSTIAILGCGLDRNYPRENSDLKLQIVQAGGLLISPFAGDMAPQPGQFIFRNRLIAGWTNATWVVEASCPSGALNTAKWARDYHRRVYATPCSPGDPVFQGNENLIDRHHAEPFWGPWSLGSQWLHFHDVDLKSKLESSEKKNPFKDNPFAIWDLSV